MLITSLIILLICVGNLFLINKYKSQYNHTIINLFLENRLLAKLMQDLINARQDNHLTLNIYNIEQFFNAQIYILDPHNKNLASVPPSELLELLQDVRPDIVNDADKNIFTNYYFDASDQIKRAHIARYISINNSNILIILDEEKDLPLSNFDLSSTLPLIINFFDLAYYMFELKKLQTLITTK
jgi:hypothetical protein